MTSITSLYDQRYSCDHAHVIQNYSELNLSFFLIKNQSKKMNDQVDKMNNQSIIKPLIKKNLRIIKNLFQR